MYRTQYILHRKVIKSLNRFTNVLRRQRYNVLLAGGKCCRGSCRMVLHTTTRTHALIYSICIEPSLGFFFPPGHLLCSRSIDSRDSLPLRHRTRANGMKYHLLLNLPFARYPRQHETPGPAAESLLPSALGQRCPHAKWYLSIFFFFFWDSTFLPNFRLITGESKPSSPCSCLHASQRLSSCTYLAGTIFQSAPNRAPTGKRVDF